MTGIQIWRPSVCRRGNRLSSNIAGHVANGVTEPVLSRVFEYWRNVDAGLGAAVRSKYDAIKTQDPAQGVMVAQDEPAAPEQESVGVGE